jgi:hypothetical protein
MGGSCHGLSFTGSDWGAALTLGIIMMTYAVQCSQHDDNFCVHMFALFN